MWIAAVSYLLGDARAREMSFFTYARRPDQCRANVIGTVPGTVTSPAALTDGFRVFDMTSRIMPDVKIHPLADLLVQVGVLHAAGLWRQTVTLGSGTERSFDDWYPVASAAAVLRGVEPLPFAAIAAIASWLPEAALRPVPLPAAHIETVLRALRDRFEELSDDQLRDFCRQRRRPEPLTSFSAWKSSWSTVRSPCWSAVGRPRSDSSCHGGGCPAGRVGLRTHT